MEQHKDLEVVTRHYHGAHLAGKQQTGFRLVNTDGPRKAIEDDHHAGVDLMEKVASILSFQQRVSAIEQFGYTHREAEFLVLAALNSGYFLRRQFSPRGKLDAAFCRKLVANGHGSVAHASNQTQVYHLSGKPLYRALGQVDNRHAAGRQAKAMER